MRNLHANELKAISGGDAFTGIPGFFWTLGVFALPLFLPPMSLANLQIPVPNDAPPRGIADRRAGS